MTSDLSVADNVQMLSHGSADLILEACTDFWDGTDIYPLSGSDRCSISLHSALHSPVKHKISKNSLQASIFLAFFLLFFTLPVTERRFWTSTSVPVCQATAQHSPTNPCRYPCPASWMGSVWSWPPVPASSPEWSCPPPLPSNTPPAGTAGAPTVRLIHRGTYCIVKLEIKLFSFFLSLSPSCLQRV